MDDQDSTIFSFWKSRAKLSWLSAEHRAKFLCSTLATAIGIAILLAFPVWRAAATGEVVVRIAGAIGLATVIPTLFALEMFYKGGRAAREITRDGDERYICKLDEWTRLAEEFTQYRIAKEQEVKDIERDRGGTISSLQAKVAELESLIGAHLVIETSQSEDSDGLLVRLSVQNSSPLAADDVAITIDNIVVLHGASGAEKFIDVLRELHLLPRNSEDRSVSISGFGKREFHFLSVNKKENSGIAVIHERCTVSRRAGILGESIQLPFFLPSGGYRFSLIVHAKNRAACRIYCEVSNQGGQSFRAADAQQRPLNSSSATQEINLRFGPAVDSKEV